MHVYIVKPTTLQVQYCIWKYLSYRYLYKIQTILLSGLKRNYVHSISFMYIYYINIFKKFQMDVRNNRNNIETLKTQYLTTIEKYSTTTLTLSKKSSWHSNGRLKRNIEHTLTNFNNLLHQIHWTNFNQTWHKLSLGEGDSSLFKWRAPPFSKGR